MALHASDPSILLVMEAKTSFRELPMLYQSTIYIGRFGTRTYFQSSFHRTRPDGRRVRTLVQKSFKTALDENDILISPAAPSAAYKIGEKKSDPLAMYAGDIMTVNINLAGLPALVLPCGLVQGGSAGLPVGIQMIGAAFDEVGG
ncbi:unnamed protein product [Ilex paraguariensis]|uniref:Amidase domain-containing protein n=1 Tax=Ilex paraguariensis TaxID=185542 RepID=A0ABC8SNZ2_9AQUA